ncbi:MAG: M23 family metallopeptidase [Spirochaetaceae bacterium]|jgi:murein DD-endopeptidase MepM/ murein hydrolase activator NlpD|nr:M23 family metallopeptidase [Spirochaetaceae bacterium]
MNMGSGGLHPLFYTMLLCIYATMYIGAEETVHIVQGGDTIYSIARSYQIDIDTLMKANGITDPQKLPIGKRLNVPSAKTAGFTEYQVLKGDTLYSIARRHAISLDTLRKTNGLGASYVLKEGDLLKIPLNEPEKEVPVTRTKPAATAPQGAAKTGKALRWPVAAKEVNYMTGKVYGVVLVGEKSEAVKSLTTGTVVSAGPYRGFGRVVIVQVTGGYLYVYGGCERLSVKQGDKVASGTELGKLGLDTVSKKPQLFFLVYQSNTPIDPAKAPRT